MLIFHEESMIDTGVRNDLSYILAKRMRVMKVIFCLKKRYSWKIAAKIVTVAPKYQLFTDATTMYCNHYSISFFLFFHSCHELIIFCHSTYDPGATEDNGLR